VRIERGRGGHELVRRARLVRIHHGAVATLVVAKLPEFARVEVRGVGQRQYFTGVWVHYDGRAVERVKRRILLEQRTFRYELQIRIDR